MYKIAIFLRTAALCDFFSANMFRIFSKDSGVWEIEREVAFTPIEAGDARLIRDSTDKLIPLINDCTVLAGGKLMGIPFLTFNKVGLHIFEIGEISDALFDEMLADVHSAERERQRIDGVVRDTKPVETQTPGVYVLNLIELQTEFPEISSKKALTEFLERTPFIELRLLCAHVPPWIENNGAYLIKSTNKADGSVLAVISHNCEERSEVK